MLQGFYETRYLRWLGRAVAIESYDHVTASGGETTRQCVPFTVATLADDAYVRPAPPGNDDSVIVTVAIDQDDLEKVSGQAR
jgi:hypothetical protein